MGNVHYMKHSFPNNIDDLKFLKSNKIKHTKRLTKKGFNSHFKFRWSVHSRPEHVYVVHYVTSVGSVEGLRQVITLGADVNQKTDSGLTPVHFAILYRNIQVLDELVEWGADTDEKEHGMGFTALHYACQNRDFIGAKKLLTLSADTQIKDKSNRTPLDIAKDLNNRPLIKLLSNHCKKSVNSQHLAAFRKQVNMSLHQLSQKIGELGLEVGSVMPGSGSFYGYNNIEMNSRQPSQLGPRSGSYASLTSVGTIQSLLESGIGTLDEEFTTVSTSKCDQYMYPEAEKIQENFEELNFNLTHTTEIINKLFAKKLISLRFKDKLKQMYGSEKNEELLDYIIRSSNVTYQAFLSGLKETGQTKLATLLQPDYEHHVDNVVTVTENSLPTRHNTLPRSVSNNRNINTATVTSYENDRLHSYSMQPTLANSLGNNLNILNHNEDLFTSGTLKLGQYHTLQSNPLGAITQTRHVSHPSDHNNNISHNYISGPSNSFPLLRNQTVSLSGNMSVPVMSISTQRSQTDFTNNNLHKMAHATSKSPKISHNDTFESNLSVSVATKSTYSNTFDSKISVPLITVPFERSHNNTIDSNVSAPVISLPFERSHNNTLDSNIIVPVISPPFQRSHSYNISEPIISHSQRSHQDNLNKNTFAPEMFYDVPEPISSVRINNNHNDTLESNVSIPVSPTTRTAYTDTLENKRAPISSAPFQRDILKYDRSKRSITALSPNSHTHTLGNSVLQPSIPLSYRNRTLSAEAPSQTLLTGNSITSTINNFATESHIDSLRNNITKPHSVKSNQKLITEKLNISGAEHFLEISKTSALPPDILDDILDASKTRNLKQLSSQSQIIENTYTDNTQDAAYMKVDSKVSTSVSVGKFYDATQMFDGMKGLSNSRRPICVNESDKKEAKIQEQSTTHSVYV